MYRILIVEDDAVIASALEKHLETWGWIVKTVENFENVLGEFTSFEPQLVLLDISLPFYNGIPLVQSDPGSLQSAGDFYFFRLR